MNKSAAPVDISIIVPVEERRDDAAQIYEQYKAGLEELGRTFEFIFVLDGPRVDFAAGLQELVDRGEPVCVVQLTRWFGEATAIMAGFEQAKGEVIATLPAYFQVMPGDFGKLIAGLEDADLVVARRHPRAGSSFENWRRKLFHGLLSWITRLPFRDLGCGVRFFKRQMLEELQIYGDQQRFLPVLADHQGFKVAEIDARQSPNDRFSGRYGLADYARSFLDLVTVFFLVRFTKKPLRFFGMLGASTFVAGGLLISIMVIQRLFFDQALASRPALLLASLLVVLGLQLFAIGLLGELVIFTHARKLRDYKIDRVIEFPDAGPPKMELTRQKSAN